MAKLKVTATFTTPDTPNFPGSTPEAFAIAVLVKQGDTVVANDSRIPPASPSVFDFTVAPGTYDVSVFIADNAWNPIGTVLTKSVTVAADVVRPVLAGVEIG